MEREELVANAIAKVDGEMCSRDRAGEYIAALEAQGLAVVPVVPTEGMLEAGDMGLSNAGVDNSTTEDARFCYTAMLAAARGGVKALGENEMTDKLAIVGTATPQPSITFHGNNAEPVMIIRPDGKIELADHADPTEAAAQCIEAMSEMISNMNDNAVKAERAAVVVWLRAEAQMCDCAAREDSECACGAWDTEPGERSYKRVYIEDIADAIEGGEHLK